jgi:hypothetical protein
MLRRVYWLNGWIVRVDDGETDESLADLYVTPTLPASRTEGAKGFIDHTQWDYPRSFAVEIECYPNKHWDRLQNNYQRNKKMGFPTVFVVPNQHDATQLQEKLWDWKATIVANAARFEPNRPEMVAIEIAKTLDNQTNNSEPNKTYDVESAIHQIESAIEPPKGLSESVELSESLSDVSEGSLGVGLQTGGVLVLELAKMGWWFRVRTSRGKPYLCARKGSKERCIGQFNAELCRVVEENNIPIKGREDNTKKENP